MKSKSGLLLSLAVLAAVAAGLVLPGYLLKLEKIPSFDLDGYQTVEVSTASSTDFAWRLRVISSFFIRGGSDDYAYSDVTEQYTQEQRGNIHQKFISQLTDLESRGVLASGTAEKASRSRSIDSYITYLFDGAVLRGTQFARVFVPDPDEKGLLMISGIMDLESGKILGLFGYTSVWQGLMDQISAEETTYQEILASYAEYLGMVEPAQGTDGSEEPPRTFYPDENHYTAELRLVALPSDRASAMQLWLEVMGESFLLHLQS